MVALYRFSIAVEFLRFRSLLIDTTIAMLLLVVGLCMLRVFWTVPMR